ncbi:hypothetical protein BGZ63DRAFT_422035 [Mariannaea sp. PMI_226]|nr:hypothetical protein BGZ63DRAFT_422035 [Mariannaea sp. PMI_226]
MSAQEYYGSSGNDGSSQGGYNQQGYNQQTGNYQGYNQNGPNLHTNPQQLSYPGQQPNGNSYSQQRQDSQFNLPQGHPGSAIQGQDGEKGLGATVLGGGVAGFAAHKAGGGVLASIASAAAGAIGANIVEHKFKRYKRTKNRRHHRDGRARAFSGDSTSSSDSEDDEGRRRHGHGHGGHHTGHGGRRR